MKALVAALIASLMAAPVFACGADSKCDVGERYYHIAMPDGHDGTTPVGVLIWAHGYGGSAAGVMQNTSLRRMVSDADLALIAVQGVDGSWDLPYGPRTFDSTGAAEFAYFDAVIADAASRFAINPDQIIASGFSAGGMMVWNLACSHPRQFAGFIPVSGTFWLKPPDTCVQPVSSIVHIHGDSDQTVPLTGRPIGPTKQGKVEDALSMYAAFGAFGPAEASTPDDLQCSTRTNPEGKILEFCLFRGGHVLRTEYLKYALDRLRAAGQF